MRLGLFGGSFDPPHAGHLEPVRAARERFHLDRVLFLPTARPPHKTERRQAPPEARYTMVELALLKEEGFFASAHELTPGRPAYTVETLEHFGKHFRGGRPGDELFLLLGSDSFLNLPSWRRWEELADLAHLIVLTRPGWAGDDLLERLHPSLRAWLEDGRASLCEGPAVPLSSTRLREAIRNGETLPEGAVPPLVLDYVGKYDLYR